MPGKRRKYAKPELKKLQSAEKKDDLQGKRIKKGGLRNARLIIFEESLMSLVNTIDRIAKYEGVGGGRRAEHQKTMLKEQIEHTKKSLEEIKSNYKMAPSQKVVVRDIEKALEKPTRENILHAHMNTCRLKFE